MISKENLKKLFVNKKSQAALEFIMTYGWAILVVLVAVGALAYFGVLSPDKFLPSKCTLQSGLACIDHKVQAAPAGTGNAGLVTVVLQNSLGFDLSSVIVGAGDCGNSGSGVSMANGAQATFLVNCVGGGIAEQTIAAATSKYNKQLNVSYTIVDTSLSHKNLGQLTARVE